MEKEHDWKREEKYAIAGGVNDRGPLEFKDHISRKEGSIMSMASTNVVSVPPTMSIKGAAETMTRYRFRRLPVVDPGTNRVKGIIGSTDILDFLGGGEKAQLLTEKYGGNFLAAINESVDQVMVNDVITLPSTASVEDALKEITGSRIGGIVVVDEDNSIKGVVTEKDFIDLIAGKKTGIQASEAMSSRVISTTPGTALGDATKIMVRNSFRRLPVTSQDFLEGMITSRIILDFLGNGEIFKKIVKNEVNEILDTKVREIMDEDVPVASQDTDLGELASLMEERGTGTVCIVQDSKLLGIITERDIVKVLTK